MSQQTSLTLDEPAPSNGRAETMEAKATGRGRPVGRKLKPVPVNMSGIYPTEFNVLVMPDKAEEYYAGTQIIKAVDTVDKEENASQTGTIIAVSPLAFTYETWPEGAPKPQVGDKIIYAKYAGFLRKAKDGNDYRIMKDKDIVATFE